MRAFLAEQIAAAQSAQDTALRVDPSHAATALMALVDGLGAHILGQHYAAADAVAALDAHLNVLFGAI